MKAVSALFILVFLIASCGNDEPKNTQQETRIDSLKKPAAQQNETGKTNEDFLVFWQGFRNAVLNADTAKIISMTSFPFQTRGVSDYDPVVEYKQKDFVAIFFAYLNQWNGMDMNGTTELDHIKQTEVPNKKDIQGDMVRIGDLEFEKINNKWRAVFAYLNNETIESLKK